MVAFHFPPLIGSSGMQRTLGFARHLPNSGWKPIVLAPQPRAYPRVDARQNDLIPDSLCLHRSFCLDSARHLAIRGRYPGMLARPDRWTSWIPGAVLTGLKIIRRHNPDVIWSTYPIATSHTIANILSRLSGVPWIADFRDPMVERDPRTGRDYPTNDKLRASRLRVESTCVKNASALVFCTDWSRRICVERYPRASRSKFHVISNGYEEALFEHIKTRNDHSTSAAKRRRVLLHSGTIYPTPDRDPTHFFDAVASLKEKGQIDSGCLRISLRATGHDEVMRKLIEERRIQDMVRLEPRIPYRDALAEIVAADGLLVFQGYTSNPAIPAKVYEYLRARKPILGLLDAEGSTAQLLRSLGIHSTASIENAVEIEQALLQFLKSLENPSYPMPSDEQVASYSRMSLTRQLVQICDELGSTRLESRR